MESVHSKTQVSLLEVSQEELELALQNRKTFVCSNANVKSSSGQNDGTRLKIVHTHMSMVVMFPEQVYKVKKHVNLGFADFTSLNKRFKACIAEVELNKTLAPNVYLGIVPIYMKRETREISVRCDTYWTPERNEHSDWFQNDQFGEIIDWAVHMVRLPDEWSLMHLLDQGKLTEKMLEQLVEKLVNFHKTAIRGRDIDQFGKISMVCNNMDDNFDQTASHVGITVNETVYNRVKKLSYIWLETLKPIIESRVELGCICDTHGDLRLEHVFQLPSSSNKEEDFVIIDRIEFNEKFRFGDPFSDVAFLSMDMWQRGRYDLAQLLKHKYLEKAGQRSVNCADLYTFYEAYRAVVRAKVCGFRAMESTIPAASRAEEIQKARCHWLVALEMLSQPNERPCLILIGGLPASGKSTLSRMLVECDKSLVWLRSDVIRKELAVHQDKKLTAQGVEMLEESLYSMNMTCSTYEELLKRSIKHLRDGGRVIVDATFQHHTKRQEFITAGKMEGALVVFIMCECDRKIAKSRMLARKNDVSDATWEVYEQMEKTWQFSVDLMIEYRVVRTDWDQEETLHRAQDILCRVGVW
ncbi:aminoglycoside phosphotransferase [Plasmopara halstedii]|uniref:Aminoglycoside phosphotransferase n=1 Tax=Plasmopara halstedii TaxID=4781 RepID=A0A0P1B751_PLAHL|nr:aminoglycoside phosphotransferase [Plasmopara halstedii]CEG49505.1 aminoglycoside phosphotransferase [Plasmopara halstedii]|eukprot:XP_024585874.1 aminoglycoside phosphotransferase [Plasmopara halstedii]